MHYEYGKLVDMSKFDGCNWVIESEKLFYEPSNLAAFNIDLVDSIDVRFAYEIEKDKNIGCKMGQPIKLIDIAHLAK